MNARSGVPAVSSPCCGVCRLDNARGYCVGCGRTGDEIGFWRGADETVRASILAELPSRLDALDRTLVPVGGVDFVRKALAPILAGQGGRVIVGCHGAEATFAPPHGDAARVHDDNGRLEAVIPGATLRLALHENMTAHASAVDGDGTIIVAVPGGSFYFRLLF